MGVITLGALIGMAAHLDGKGVSVLDMTGLAQKYGAVFSHLRIADHDEDIHAARIATSEAHAVLGGDLVVSASAEALGKMREGQTRAVVSCAATPTAEFTRNRDWQFPAAALQQRLSDCLGAGAVRFINAEHLATRLLGNSLYANMILLGYAWQLGLVPVSAAALDQALELNGAAVAANRQALLWGRRAAVDGDRVAAMVGAAAGETPQELSLDALIAHRAGHLSGYQNAALAARYRHRVAAIRQLGDEALTRLVANQYARLLAPKDEFEVARLYVNGDFSRQLAATFEGDYRISYHLAPPLFARLGVDGRPRKIRFGAWLHSLLQGLAWARRLRGSWLDPFRRSPERALDRRLLADYEADLELLLNCPDLPERHLLAAWPAAVRGYGPIRGEAAAEAAATREHLRQALQA